MVVLEEKLMSLERKTKNRMNDDDRKLMHTEQPVKHTYMYLVSLQGWDFYPFVFLSWNYTRFFFSFTSGNQRLCSFQYG